MKYSIQCVKTSIVQLGPKCRPSLQIVDINLRSGHSIGCILANNFVATANANSNWIIMLDLRIKSQIQFDLPATSPGYIGSVSSLASKLAMSKYKIKCSILSEFKLPPQKRTFTRQHHFCATRCCRKTINSKSTVNCWNLPFIIQP